MSVTHFSLTILVPFVATSLLATLSTLATLPSGFLALHVPILVSAIALISTLRPLTALLLVALAAFLVAAILPSTAPFVSALFLIRHLLLLLK